MTSLTIFTRSKPASIPFIRTKPAPRVRLTNQPISRQASDTVKLRNEITRPSPFLISISDEELNDQGFIEKKYGENDVIRAYGKLCAKDRQTLITLLEMSNQLGQPLVIKVSDIASAQGIKNPYAESTLGPIRESLDRLRQVRIEINPEPSKEKKNSCTFIFLHGGRKDNDDCELYLAEYLDIYDKNIGFFIEPSKYRALGGPIAQALYPFLKSQQSIYEGGTYKSRLAKLCRYINYDPAGRPWSRIWPHIEQALKQLSKEGVIEKYSRDKNKHRGEGGLITIHGPNRKQIEDKTGENSCVTVAPAPAAPAAPAALVSVRRAPVPTAASDGKHKKHPLIEYWNTLPGLRTHRTGTCMYRNTSKLLNLLMEKGLGKYKFDPEWIKHARVNVRFLQEPWTEAAVRKAMDIVAQMVQPSYFPGPGSYLVKCSLYDVIYNARKQNSTLVSARSNMIARMEKSVHEEILRKKMSPQELKLLSIFEEYSIQIPLNFPQILCNMCNNLRETGPLARHLFSSCSDFALILAEWLSGNNLLQPRSGLLPPDGWIWKNFIHSTLGE